MIRSHRSGAVALAAVGLTLAGLLLAAASTAVETAKPTVTEVNHVDGIQWETKARYGSATLVVVGPAGFYWQQSFAPDDTLFLDFSSITKQHAPDGQYAYELVLAPRIDAADLALARQARELGQEVDFLAPAAIEPLSGTFTVAGGAVIYRDLTEQSLKDFVVGDDLIAQGSLCVGLDCINNEIFDFDTIRLKENNLRIHFLDTSVGGFPTTDWRIVINDSSSGGGGYFAVEDSDRARQVFRVDANAPANALRVSSAGRVGIRTGVPALDLHIASGNTPALRLEQDNSSGFTPQTWDIAGNESNFFIRDVTAGSRLPFRILPNANSNSIFVDANGIRLNHNAAALGRVHARAANNTEDTFVAEGTVLAGGGPARFALINTSTGSGTLGIRWIFNAANNGAFNISDQEANGNPGASGTEFSLDRSGNLTVLGNYFSATCTAPGSPCAPDYVFAEDYPLMPLEELAAFIGTNKHLPNVPSEGELRQAQKINLSAFQMTLLEKIEELTLYTLQQHNTIAAQRADLDRLAARLAALEDD